MHTIEMFKIPKFIQTLVALQSGDALFAVTLSSHGVTWASTVWFESMFVAMTIYMMVNLIKDSHKHCGVTFGALVLVACIGTFEFDHVALGRKCLVFY